MLTVPAAREHFSREVAKGLRRKLLNVKSRSNQPSLRTPYINDAFAIDITCPPSSADRTGLILSTTSSYEYERMAVSRFADVG
jgi:hypothetical protein